MAKIDSIGVGGAQMAPVFGREVVERHQAITILGQGLDRLRVFGLVDRSELVERFRCRILSRRHPDRLQVGLGLALHTLGRAVEHVGGLVHPAALFSRMAG